MITGPTPGASYRLSAGRRIVGRDADLDIAIDDIKVSRHHAVIDVAGGRTVVTDQQSTNGTWVNDNRIQQPTELRDGDRIRFGAVELRFYDPASALTDPVGTRIPRADTAALTAGPVRPTTGMRSLHAALGEPTQPMRPRRRPSLLLMAGLGGAFLIGWLTWLIVVLT
ncbi:FHA domain-containing protein [Solwaraspora sp. WMMB335]|uniref:FHA domain-containing protein n=1 Tax=Solwaraspora sp. WMMB335 TaxID=3404118 RepID=UPI003B928FF2